MLVLTRKRGEVVNLYYPLPDGGKGKISVHVRKISGVVSLGFEADKDIRIVRLEVEERHGNDLPGNTVSESGRPIHVGEAVCDGHGIRCGMAEQLEQDGACGCGTGAVCPVRQS